MAHKEIHAYLNEDGTYQVTIKSCFASERKTGKETIKENINGEINIGRANINIQILNDPSTNQLYTVTV